MDCKIIVNGFKWVVNSAQGPVLQWLKQICLYSLLMNYTPLITYSLP